MAASLIGASARAQDGSFGTDIPLGAAAKQIVPSGYKVDMGPGVDAGASVTWTKEDSWKKAISKAAASGGYSVAYAGMTVKIVKSGAAATPVAAAAEAAPEADKSAEPAAKVRRHTVRRPPVRHYVRHAEPAEQAGVEEARGPSVPASGFVLVPVREAAPSPSPQPPSSGEWKVAGGAGGAAPVRGGFDALAGRSLSSVLQEWAEREGWRVEWKSTYQYTLTSSAHFGGGFVEASSELVRSMSGLRPQPTVSFYKGNKVVVVGNDGLDEASN